MSKSRDYEAKTTSLSCEAEYPMEPIEWILLAVQIWCFWLVSVWKYIDFQTGHFSNFGQFKIDSDIFDFGIFKINSTCSNLLPVGRSQIFYWVCTRRDAIFMLLLLFHGFYSFFILRDFIIVPSDFRWFKGT